MPPYHLDTDLLAAMFAAVPPPPPDAPMAWRQQRATRLVCKVAGMMPADAPQARIAAEIVIVREATEDSLAWANAPGLAVEQVCRLRRTAAALLTSAATLERCLVRHQQKPVRFFRHRAGRRDRYCRDCRGLGWQGGARGRRRGTVQRVVPVGRLAATKVANSRTCASTS
jgi:hypothetical protein